MSDWTTNSDPKLLRIAMTTATTPDLEALESSYRQWLGYRTIERGEIDVGLAASWHAPAAAGSRYCVMVSENEPDVFVRAIEAPAVPGYRPLTTFGWTAFEIIVDDVYLLADRIAGGPFEVLAPPEPLRFMPSIIAMQVKGPGGECLYFTMESGDRDASILPKPRAFVGRTFIVVAAGPEFDRSLRWYVDHFDLRERPVRACKVPIVQSAQGLGPDHAIALSAIGLHEHGNLLEIDEYPTGEGFVAGPRPRAAGHLPPGNAIVAFGVASIDPYAALATASPRRRSEAGYGGRRTCTIIGPSGELIELIEDS